MGSGTSDKDYLSDNYSFSHNYTSDRNAKVTILNGYPKGKETHCFVNPQSPSEAVLLRERPADLWAGLFGLPFLFVGLGLPAYAVLGAVRRMALREAPKVYATPGLRIKPISSGKSPILALTVIWNLFIGSAIFFVAKQWDTNQNYLAAAILLLFGVIGILMLFSLIQRRFVIFRPKLEIKAYGYRLGRP